MFKIFIILVFTAFALPALASDTTIVKIVFAKNNDGLNKRAKEILDDVEPDDSSITLIKITIYGYCDSSEQAKKNTLPLSRAMAVKKYLIEKGMKPSLFVIAENHGIKKAIPIEDGLQESNDDNKCVVLVIEYDAAIIEKTIIIKSGQLPQKLRT